MVGEKSGAVVKDHSVLQKLGLRDQRMPQPLPSQEQPGKTAVDWDEFGALAAEKNSSITFLENGQSLTKPLTDFTPNELIAFGIDGLYQAQTLEEFLGALATIAAGPDIVSLGGKEGEGTYATADLIKVVSELRNDANTGKVIDPVLVPDILNLRQLFARRPGQSSMP